MRNSGYTPSTEAKWTIGSSGSTINFARLPNRRDHTILGPWINEAKTEFVWIRTYDIAADAEAKDGRFYGSPEWKAVGREAGEFLAKIEVTIMSTPLPPGDK